MYIVKVINNNVISAVDRDGSEIIAMGKGVGFGRKSGDIVEDACVEKIFRMENEEILRRFKDLLASLPLEHIQVSNEIISYSKKLLGVRLNQNIYITLTDHINFVIVRFQEGMQFENALADEVQAFYPEEYRIGRYALSLIEEKTGIRLPKDEAASIAMHIITAEYNTPVRNIFKAAAVIKKASGLARRRLSLTCGEDGAGWNQFLINLKFLAMSLGNREETDEPGQAAMLYEFIREQYEIVFLCAEEIASYLEEESEKKLGTSERAYLAMELLRLQDHDHDKKSTEQVKGEAAWDF